MGRNKGKIIMNIGLPASGKSTDSYQKMEKNGNLMRVNRDDIRKMLFHKWAGKKEGVVTDIEENAVTAAISAGFDIIIDDTNLNPKTQQKWATIAEMWKTKLEKNDFTNVSIEECIRRDWLREDNQVGRPVIEDMAFNYGLVPKIKPEDRVVIFDVDGTLANCEHRLKYLQKKPKDWHSFLTETQWDKPIQTVIDWCNECHKSGYYVLIVSGRASDLAGIDTCQWLEDHQVDYHHILMRKGGDGREDFIIKKEILDKILRWVPKDQILFAVDDRQQVIRMWKENGIKVYDVGPGIEF